MIYNRIESKKGKKIKYNPGKHIPNKSESDLLRKLMSENSLSEDEVRADIKYRRMLADASRENQPSTRKKIDKFYYNIIKRGCRVSKLAPQHPESVKAIQSVLDTYSRWWIPFYINPLITDANVVIKRYAKK